MFNGRLYLVCVVFLGCAGLIAVGGMAICSVERVPIPPALSGLAGSTLGSLGTLLALQTQRGQPREPP